MPRSQGRHTGRQSAYSYLERMFLRWQLPMTDQAKVECYVSYHLDEEGVVEHVNGYRYNVLTIQGGIFSAYLDDVEVWLKG